MKNFVIVLIFYLAGFNCSFSQELIEPIDYPYFVLSRSNEYVSIPKELGGKNVKGFAGIEIIIDSTGRIVDTKLIALKLSGKVDLYYQNERDKKNEIINKFEAFIKKYTSNLKIIKVDKRKPPKLNRILFLIRFK